MPEPTALQAVAHELDSLRQSGLFTHIRTLTSPQGAWLVVDGRQVLNFCSNNYLGLANHPRLVQAAKDAIDQYGVGPAAVRTIAGTMGLHVELERRLAAFKGVEAAITFQSGFSANLGTIPALVGRDDVIFSDELNHASIIDGCRLSGANVIRYAHVDLADLRARARREPVPAPRPAADHHRRRVQHGRRYRPVGGDLCRRPRVRLPADGGRRPWRGRAGTRRARYRRPLRSARQGRRGDRHTVQGLRGCRRAGGWAAGDHRLAAPARPAIPILLGDDRPRCGGVPGGD